jgi:HKD family nuclease
MSQLIDNSSQTLEHTLKNTLPQTESVDILAAYFYFSGFSVLANELKDKRIRILVGKSIDPDAASELSAAIRSYPNVDLNTYQNKKYYSLSCSQRKKEYTESFIQLFKKSSLSESFDRSASQEMQTIFEQKLRDGSLEIRMTSEDNHARTYILRNKPEFSANGDSKGVLFMDSSNSTYSGLIGQGELNERRPPATRWPISSRIRTSAGTENRDWERESDRRTTKAALWGRL